jgi:hypothetical protein
MALSVNDAGTWKTVKTLRVNDGGTWKAVKTGWINDSGTWKKFYSGTTTVNVASQNNINLRTLYTNQTGDSSSAAVSVIFNINGNIGSTSTASAATVTGTWPAGSEIIVNVATGVYMVGAGGSPTSNAGARNGGAGGNAISLSYNITINNSGIIGGGGGAGGGYYESYPNYGAVNSYGGGGAGLSAGSSAGGSGSGTLTSGGGQSGDTQANACGYGFCSCGYWAAGGSGGGLGQNGTDGQSRWSGGRCDGVTAYPYATPGSGGTAGKAIALNGYTATRTGNAPLGVVG